MSDEEMKVIKVEFVAREDPEEGGKTEDRQGALAQHPKKYRSLFQSERQQPLKKKGKSKRKISKFGIKTAVACVILVACLAISMLDTPFTKKAASVINSILTYNLNIDESIGQLKFVQNIFPGTTAVFGGQTSLRYPCEGNIVAKFGEGDCKGLRIQAAPMAKVTAAADGRVIKRGVNETLGNYIRLSHTGNVETFYYGLGKSALDEGDQVKVGDEIGTLTQSGALYFEMHIGGKQQDPQKYIGADNQ